ncbi:DinB family protein [Gracilimonas sp.]|uniref:DinB family protein n=1 Tax=Gracilimonas sp. TaxID=1974203 RepID=UPI0032EADAEA
MNMFKNPRTKYINSLVLIVPMLIYYSAGLYHQDLNFDVIQENFKKSKSNTLSILEAMPEDKYAYAPVDSVRSFSAQAYHIAYTLEFMRNQFSGKDNKWNPGDENSMSKAELIEWTKNGFDEMENFLNETKYNDRLLTNLISVLDHNAHHKGQMIIYLRLNNIAPPEYQF